MATKLIQDKVKQIVKQQKAAAEASAETAVNIAASSSATNLPQAGQSQSSQPQSAASQTAAGQQSGTVQQTHSQVNLASAGQPAVGFPVSASSPVLQNLTSADQHQSTDSGISGVDQRKSETNGSTVSSHPSDATVSSQHSSQQVLAPKSAVATQLSSAASATAGSEPTTNLSSTAAASLPGQSQPLQPKQQPQSSAMHQQTNLASSMHTVVGSQAGALAAHQPASSDPHTTAAASSSTALNPSTVSDHKSDQVLPGSQTPGSRPPIAGVSHQMNDMSSVLMTSASEGSSLSGSTASSTTQTEV